MWLAKIPRGKQGVRLPPPEVHLCLMCHKILLLNFQRARSGKNVFGGFVAG